MSDSTKNGPYVAIYASAIRCRLWQGLSDRLVTTNNCEVRIFLCGHLRPLENLSVSDSSPLKTMSKDIVYIYSGMEAAACAEIAYRHAMDSNPDFIMNYQDDLVSDPGMLDKLLDEFLKLEKSHPNSEIVVGPGFRPNKKNNSRPINLEILAPSGSELILGEGSDCGLGLNYLLMRRSLAEKVGGLDSRWQGGCPGWIEDLTLRLELLGNVLFKACADAQLCEDTAYQRGGELPGGKRLTHRYLQNGKAGLGPDVFLYETLWNEDPKQKRESLGKKERKHMLTPDYPLKRTEEVQYYESDELIFHLCREECSDSHERMEQILLDPNNKKKIKIEEPNDVAAVEVASKESAPDPVETKKPMASDRRGRTRH